MKGVEGDAAKADFIASRVKRTCTEKMEEDPVLYQKLSEVIDEAIKAYLEKRMTEEEYLQKMLETWKEAQEQGSSKVPSELRGHPDAKAYFRLLLDGFGKAAGADKRNDLAGDCRRDGVEGDEGYRGQEDPGLDRQSRCRELDAERLGGSALRREGPVRHRRSRRRTSTRSWRGVIRVAKRRDMPAVKVLERCSRSDLSSSSGGSESSTNSGTRRGRLWRSTFIPTCPWW